jgi:alcohol dehydrogenase
LPPAPFVPGMSVVGEVEAVGKDVRGLAPGIRVYCDPYIASSNPTAPRDGAFIGYFGFTPEAAAVLARWPDGGFAEKAVFPAECLTPLGDAGHGVEPAVLTRLGHIGTGHEALCRGGFEPGRTVLVTGATGLLGVSTVLLALAMGAGRVIAAGRRADVLARLYSLAPRHLRVVTVGDPAKLTGEARGADILVECMGRTPDASVLTAAIAALRPGGSAVLVGGGGAFSLDYGDLLMREIAVRGSLWFPRRAIADILALIGTGALDLTTIKARRFSLDQANDAVAAAASPERAGGFEHCAVVP